jgi:hypothetical protein
MAATGPSSYCVNCGAQVRQNSNFCIACGASPMYSQQSYPQQQLYPQKPLAGSVAHHMAARGFAQIFGIHPAVAFLTIAVDLMMNVGTYGTLGALWIFTLPVGLVLGIIAYMAQKKWYGDDNESAAIKAMIVALLTAIPAPVSPILIPSGIVGLFSRKKN